MSISNLTEFPGGSHNRDSTKSHEFVIESVGKFKTCKCPLHYNFGKGTSVELTKFRRHDNGSQGMCFEGKTLIDSYSHQLKRLQLLFTAKPESINNIFNDYPKKFSYLTQNISKIVKAVNKHKFNGTKNEINLQKLTLLDSKLKTKQSGFYEANISNKDKYDFNERLKLIFTDQLKEELYKIQSGWIKGYFVVDSKDGLLYPVEEFAFNISKKREVYDKNKRLTPYRINIHNTRAKGQRSSTLRAEKYLADGKYTEANRKMKELGRLNKHIHADHIIPLRLGGIHDIKNLQELSGKDNIYKKDKLTINALQLLKKDVSFLSHWFWEVFNENKSQPIEVIEQILKKQVDDFRKKIISLPSKKKVAFISKIYPTYKKEQVTRIIEKHFTKFNNDED